MVALVRSASSIFTETEGLQLVASSLRFSLGSAIGGEPRALLLAFSSLVCKYQMGKEYIREKVRNGIYLGKGVGLMIQHFPCSGPLGGCLTVGQTQAKWSDKNKIGRYPMCCGTGVILPAVYVATWREWQVRGGRRLASI